MAHQHAPNTTDILSDEVLAVLNSSPGKTVMSGNTVMVILLLLIAFALFQVRIPMNISTRYKWSKNMHSTIITATSASHISEKEQITTLVLHPDDTGAISYSPGQIDSISAIGSKLAFHLSPASSAIGGHVSTSNSWDGYITLKIKAVVLWKWLLFKFSARSLQEEPLI